LIGDKFLQIFVLTGNDQDVARHWVVATFRLKESRSEVAAQKRLAYGNFSATC